MSKAFAGLVLVFGLASVPALAADVRKIHRTVTLDVHGTVAIRSFKGSIEVEPWGEPQADVFARIEADRLVATTAESPSASGGGTLDAAFRLDERIVNRRERVYEQKVNGGGPRLELSTRSGSIQITEG